VTKKRPLLSRLRFETVGSITAIVVGVAALFVSINEAHNAREQRYASALPILMGGAGSSGNASTVRFRVGFANAGAGTALIQSVSLYVDGELIDTRDALQTRVLGEGLLIEESDYSIDQAEMRPLPAGEGVDALELVWPRTDETAAAQSQLLEALSTGLLTVEACFCDIYDRCWASQAGQFPEAVDACPAPTGFPIELIFGEEEGD
jgi:archaellum component FlaF (FlaF/FlaG flagellin family)